MCSFVTLFVRRPTWTLVGFGVGLLFFRFGVSGRLARRPLPRLCEEPELEEREELELPEREEPEEEEEPEPEEELPEDEERDPELLLDPLLFDPPLFFFSLSLPLSFVSFSFVLSLDFSLSSLLLGSVLTILHWVYNFGEEIFF